MTRLAVAPVMTTVTDMSASTPACLGRWRQRNAILDKLDPAVAQMLNACPASRLRVVEGDVAARQDSARHIDASMGRRVWW